MVVVSGFMFLGYTLMVHRNPEVMFRTPLLFCRRFFRPVAIIHFRLMLISGGLKQTALFLCVWAGWK
jgi:hypothetical protein